MSGVKSVEYGTDALTKLTARIRNTGARNILLVTGKASFEASGASQIIDELRSFARVVRWCDFSPNTDAQDLLTGLNHTSDMAADFIVGVGGGSVMDMAKLLAAFPHQRTGDDLHAAIRSGSPIVERAPGLVLVPTTSGSGSEATHFAVVYIGDEKFSIAGPALRADFVGLDPQLARSGSAHQRATSGIDAVCQAIESRWAVGGTQRSRRYAELALQLLLRHLEPFVRTPTIQTSRGVLLGSHLAGRAIDISKTTAAHALSYGITKRFGVDHGSAAALTLGAFIAAHADPDAELQDSAVAADHARAMRFVLSSLKAEDGPQGQEAFAGLLRRLDLPSALEEVGAVQGDLARLASGVNIQRLGNNPVKFDGHGLVQVLDQCYALRPD